MVITRRRLLSGPRRWGCPWTWSAGKTHCGSGSRSEGEMSVSRSKLESAVRAGLRAASGKPVEEAVSHVMDTIGLVVDVEDASARETARSIRQPEPVGRSAITELAPIDTGTSSATSSGNKFRMYYTMDEIY